MCQMFMHQKKLQLKFITSFILCFSEIQTDLVTLMRIDTYKTVMAL